MKEVIEQYRADKSKIYRLKEEKATQDVEIDSFRTVYSRLQGHMSNQTHTLESTEQQLVEVYNHIDLLKRQMTDLEKEVTELRG